MNIFLLTESSNASTGEKKKCRNIWLSGFAHLEGGTDFFENLMKAMDLCLREKSSQTQSATALKNIAESK